jgi:RHS repeat-associated protein
MLPSPKNTTPFGYSKNVKVEEKSSYPFRSYPKPQISDLEVWSAYPFGSVLSSVSKGDEKYRYSFNGMEKENELKGEGNSYTTEFRLLDPRLGRWLSLDPVFQPWQSPYCTMDNNPIYLIDPKGNVAGDFYSREGKHIGSDGETDNKVYTVDNTSDIKLKENGLIDKDKTTNKEELIITHTQFQMLSGLASKEDYSNKDAIFATANAQANRIEKNQKAGKSFRFSFDSFNSKNAKKNTDGLHGYMKENRKMYQKYWNSSPELRNLNETFVMGQAAVINAWSTCGDDNTNGATSWDGKDWTIPGWAAYRRMYITDGFKWEENAIIGKDAKFTPESNPNTTVNGKQTYIITAAYGSSIYWKPAK